ncbi:hypothetical protein GCM10022392_08290 [Mucilaginibacter panaciglaebae]|uniref:Uncharacterized protein n=1 Tax=Mucilaginibacter panaciglaebae TaxID=502331 RepID=A0ABP7WI00_9SPHI
MITGIAPKISIIANRIMVTDTISLKLNGSMAYELGVIQSYKTNINKKGSGATAGTLYFIN